VWIRFGTRTVDHEWSAGEFRCAECDSVERYSLHKVRRDGYEAKLDSELDDYDG
jgi:hypothetical protein